MFLDLLSLFIGFCGGIIATVLFFFWYTRRYYN